jgi:transposase
MLSKDLPPSSTVYYYYRSWQVEGVWENINQELNRQRCLSCSGSSRFPIRQNDGKKGEVYGFDGGKKVKGRKRHIIVDCLGQVMKVLVTEANGSEGVGAMYGLMEWTERYPAALGRLNTVLADAGDRGEKFSRWVCSLVGAKVEIVANQTREFAVIAG